MSILADIMRAVATWSESDLRALLHLVRLGAPSALHRSGPDVPLERDRDPGGVVGLRRVGGVQDQIHAEVLGMWRTIRRAAGAPLPAPGDVR